MMAAFNPMKAAWNTSIAIAIGIMGPALPVIGLFGILVIRKGIINTIVPAMPKQYYGNPHLLIIGSTQNSCAIPATVKNTPVLRLNRNVFGAKIKCKIPAIAVVAAAA
jgi:hypothetical protein